MAKYEAPNDPRESALKPKRNRRQREGGRDVVPFVGLLLGLIVTVVGVFVAWQLVNTMLETEPLPISAELTVIRLTAPASPTPTPTDALPTPTPIATLTPVPTQDTSVAPSVVQIGFYAEVANTDGVGLSVRGGPSTDNVKLLTAPEGTIGLVVDGPAEGSGFTWWKVQMDDGTEGWMAADFLIPAEAPENSGE